MFEKQTLFKFLILGLAVIQLSLKGIFWLKKIKVNTKENKYFAMSLISVFPSILHNHHIALRSCIRFKPHLAVVFEHLIKTVLAKRKKKTKEK